MGKVYVIPRGAWANVPGLEAIGVDVLDRRAFTRARFRSLARARRDQVRAFLMDKTALDSLGNAYADEVLFEARIHPKTFARKLSDEEVDRLHDAIVKVLSEARDEIARRKPALDEKLRDFLKVRNRHGEPCPRCSAERSSRERGSGSEAKIAPKSAIIRRAGVRGEDSFFCPRCQPESRKSGIVDWRELDDAS
jgi:formamidopyrimidine-DNA glycosylase